MASSSTTYIIATIISTTIDVELDHKIRQYQSKLLDFHKISIPNHYYPRLVQRHLVKVLEELDCEALEAFDTIIGLKRPHETDKEHDNGDSHINKRFFYDLKQYSQ